MKTLALIGAATLMLGASALSAQEKRTADDWCRESGDWNGAARACDVREYTIPSSTISVDQASFWLNASVTCQGDKVSGCTLADIVVAGAKTGQSQWGHRDLAGNVSEWTLDNHQPAFTQTCIDCVETAPSLNRVIRGGGFGTAATGLLSAVRNYQAPLDRSQAIGFRCAYEGT